MKILIFWIVGWIIFSVGYYIDRVYFNGPCDNKKLVYRAIKYGIFSWLALMFIFAYLMLYLVFIIDETITNYLNK